MSVKPPHVGLAFLLSQVGAHAAGCFGERLVALGITAQHAGLLRTLGSNGGMTQQAVAKLFKIFPSRLVGLIDELEKKELVSRRNSPADRRSHRLHLTPRGKRCLTAIGRVTLELEADLFAGLNTAQQELLGELLARVAAQQELVPAVHPAYRQLDEQQVERKVR